jgi:peptidoglycan/LPS O-acetylase OafA/YrhL
MASASGLSTTNILDTRHHIMMRRVPALDGLRGVAILLVLLWHFFFAVHSQPRILQILKTAGCLSWSGVDLFFVLSGFLIGGILLEAKNSPRYFSTFYIRRAYRILPLYAVIVALNYLWPVAFRLLPALGNFSPSEIPLWGYLTFTQNFWSGFGRKETIVAGVTWSLAVEEQFYLTMPLLVRKLSRSHLAWVLVSTVVCAPLLRVLLRSTLKNGNGLDYGLMPCRADALCLGVLVALLVRTPHLCNILIARRSLLFWVWGMLAVALALLTWKQYSYDSHAMTGVGYSVLALFYTSCLLITLTAQGWLQKALSCRMLTELGALSYCVYLIHLLTVEGCRLILGLHFGYQSRAAHLGSLLIGVPLLFAVAKLSWRFFEQPMLRRGHAYQY